MTYYFDNNDKNKIMMISGGFDEANRKDQYQRSKEKLFSLIDRLGMTIKDIDKHPTLSDFKKKKLRKLMENRLNNL